MAQPAEFEEKEYEQPLNFELLTSSDNLLWAPGQVLENHFGFDAALLTSHIGVWQLLGFPAPLPGVILEDFNWGWIWRRVTHPRTLPTFRTNLMLQAKRPEHRMGRNSTYARLGIPGQYWQFAITIHQQAALERVARRLRNRAAICYASPAFHTATDLFENIRTRQLVAKSTFVPVERLSGHGYWLYDKPGSTGIGHSEPEQIEGTPIDELLNGLRRVNNNLPTNENALQDLQELEASIVETLGKNEESNPVITEFGRRRAIIVSQYGESPSEQGYIASKAYTTIVTFCLLTKSNWYVID